MLILIQPTDRKDLPSYAMDLYDYVPYVTLKMDFILQRHWWPVDVALVRSELPATGRELECWSGKGRIDWMAGGPHLIKRVHRNKRTIGETMDLLDGVAAADGGNGWTFIDN